MDEYGFYTVQLTDTEELNYGSCSLMMDYQEGGQEYIIYLGEDDNLNIDFEEYRWSKIAKRYISIYDQPLK